MFACLQACPRSTKIAVHDFRDGFKPRQNYERVLEFADIEDSVGTLFVLRAKSDMNPVKVMAGLDEIRHDAW